MHRALTIARSEFSSAVRSRGFLIGIMLMPLLFGAAVLLQRVVERQANSSLRLVGVVDDTGQLFRPLAAAAEAWNRGKRDIGPDVLDGPRFAVEQVAPQPDRQALRLTLSERVRRQELFAFVELPPDSSTRAAARESAITRPLLPSATYPTGSSAPCSRKWCRAASSRRTSARWWWHRC